MLEMVWDTSPKRLDPGALDGLEESMGMMRCGNSNGPFRFVGHDGGGGGQPEKQESAFKVTFPQFVPPGFRYMLASPLSPV